VAEAVRGHHERWDGSGYPRGLRAEANPLMARIISIVDVFDAVTHPRCYRSTLFTAEAALHEIVAGAGTQFDPALVRLFTEAPLGRHSDVASPARLVAVGT
jgi:HD-GYP domain-containing protein (c-di-GMP phosphodiesterase class II)